MARVPSSTTVRNITPPASTRIPYMDTVLSRIVLAPSIDRHASYPDTLRFPYGNGNIMWKGQWEILVDGYDLYDAVFNKGSSYVSNVVSNKEEPPSDTWDLLASEGTGAGGGDEFTLPIAWGDVSTKKVLTVPAGSTVLEVHLVILEPFDGINPSLTIGDASVNDRLMARIENDMTSMGTYDVYPSYKYHVTTDINYYFSNGGPGATTGSGLIVVNLVE